MGARVAMWGVALVVETRCRLHGRVGGACSSGGGKGGMGRSWALVRDTRTLRLRRTPWGGEAGGVAKDGAVVGVGARHAHPTAAKDAVGGAKPGALPRMVRSWALVRDTRTLRLRRTPWGGEAGGVAKDGAVVGVGARHAHPTAAKDAVGGAKPGALPEMGRSWALVRDTRTLRLRRTLSGGRSRGLCQGWCGRGRWCAIRAPYGCEGRRGGAKPGASPRMGRLWALVRDTRTLRLRRMPSGGRSRELCQRWGGRGRWCATRAPYGCEGRCREGEAGGFAHGGCACGAPLGLGVPTRLKHGAGLAERVWIASGRGECRAHGGPGPTLCGQGLIHAAAGGAVGVCGSDAVRRELLDVLDEGAACGFGLEQVGQALR